MVITLREALEEKLKRELAKSPGLFRQSYLEDVCSVLTLSEWSDDVLPRLIKTPNLLREIALALHDDDAFSAFFEHRVRELTLELIKEGTRYTNS